MHQAAASQGVVCGGPTLLERRDDIPEGSVKKYGWDNPPATVEHLEGDVPSDLKEKDDMVILEHPAITSMLDFSSME